MMRFGCNRDDGRDGPRVVHTGPDAAVEVRACPVDAADPNTITDQALKPRGHLGPQRAVPVVDRDLPTQVRIGWSKRHPGFGRLRALRVCSLSGSGAVQLPFRPVACSGACAATGRRCRSAMGPRPGNAPSTKYP